MVARSEDFQRGEEPFEENKALQIERSNTHGPVRWLAPTQTTFFYAGSGGETEDRPQSYGTLGHQQHENEQNDENQIHGRHRASNVDYKWTSRNTRKGRHALLVGERSMAHDVDYAAPEPTNGLVPTLKGIWRMVTRFPWDDLSYLTAVSFVSGCVLLVVNAFLSILPKLNSRIRLSPQTVVAQAVLTFIGCTLFLTSSALSYLEAVNANREGCFGWSAEQTAPSSSGYTEDLGLGVTTRLVPDTSCSSHYDYSRSGQGEDKYASTDGSAEAGAYPSSGGRGLRVFPSLQEIRDSFIYDLGFIACATLFGSSIVYWVTALASLIVTIVGVDPAPWIRVLQLVAAVGFAVSSAIFALETQDHWTVPALDTLGWHVGFWNLIGSCGFALFAIFTLAQDEASKSSSSVHYFWGCWGFLIGSAIQWYESLDKHPVERKEHSN